MTFTEAALEVLRSAGEPLHYKKITELAIAGNLLSHVGKTPEVTMSSRLATLVKKDRGQSPIIKVRPGVFALRESAMHTDKESSTETNNAEHASSETKPETMPIERPPLPGADVFPEEADDDAPILAGLEEAGGAGEERGGRRRRRRRRRGKGGVGEGGSEAGEQRRDGGEQQRRDAGNRDQGRRDRETMRFDRDQNRRDRETARFDRDADRHRDRDRDRDRGRDEQPELDFNRQPAEGDLLGKDLADAAYHVLARGDRSPATFARVADLLVRRGRLSGAAEALAPTVAAALRADAARAERAHGRSRFRISGGRVSLSEWLLPREAVRSEEAVEHAAEGQRDQVRRAFVNRLNELPAAGFAELIATWLNGEGVTALRAVRRPGSSGREFHFAGTLKRGAEENRLAFVVLRSGRDIDRETVVEARGSMHHYGSASGSWLISTGRVHPAAREEAASEGGAPVALFGGADLARAMERLGIGLRMHFVALCDVDFDLLEALGDSGETRRDRDSRDNRDRDRDFRQRDADRDRDRRPQHAREEPAREESGDGEEERPTGENKRFDLLDPEAAEASRLVPEARGWNEADADEVEDEEEQRSTVRVASEGADAEREDELAEDMETDDADEALAAEADVDADEDMRGVDLDDLENDEDGEEDEAGEDEAGGEDEA